MCGIYGGYRYDDRPLPSIKPMSKCIAHRGPDGTGIFETPNCAIGNNRLAIIDLVSGDQPFFSEDGSVVLVQNGEIYNFIELQQELAQAGIPSRTKSDTEVLLNLYLKHGISFVEKLNGMFTIAILDQRSETLHLVRDRAGVKPLFIGETDNTLYFASEIKAILEMGFPRKMSTEALHHMLTYSYVPPPLTIFEGICHLPPGYRAEITHNGMKTFQWWDITSREQSDLGEEKFIKSFLEIIEDAVRLRMRSDVPFGAFLSGGLDSSTIVSFMARHQDPPVKTFSIGFDDPRFDESAFAQQVADKFKTHHTMERVKPDLIGRWPLTVYHCDQPHGDVSYMPYLWVSELAVRDVKVVLTGDGGDELFGGYSKYTDFFNNPLAFESSPQDFATAYHRHISIFDDESKRRLYSPTFNAQTQGLNTLEITEKHLKDVAHWDRINQACYLDIALLLPGNNLVKPDRMTMAVSLEARDPFLDPRLLELSAQMPGHYKVRGNETRYLYKKAVEPILGHDLTYRKKQMFTVPIGEWFKTSLRDYVEETLFSPEALARDIFNPEVVRQYVEDHVSGRANYTREIRCFLAIEIWSKLFLDGKAPAALQEAVLA